MSVDIRFRFRLVSLLCCKLLGDYRISLVVVLFEQEIGYILFESLYHMI